MCIWDTVLNFLIAPVIRRLDQIIDKQNTIERKLMALADQMTQLQGAVAEVKQASDEEAVRVDAIIAALQAGAGDNPVVAQAITDLAETAAKLRAFHADQPVAP
jgi:chorismate mutase